MEYRHTHVQYEPIAFVKQNAGNKVHSPPKRQATAQPTGNDILRLSIL